MADLASVLADLTAESDDLDRLVADLEPAAWATDTPAVGWTIAHQIAHLTWTDVASLAAIGDPDEFARLLQAGMQDPTGFVDAAAERVAATPPDELLRRWREDRKRLADALAAVPAGQKIAWFGPPMSAASMATARIMETWAHGQDVADALGVERIPTARIRHVAHIGVRTRNFAFQLNQLTPPAEEFRVELTGPDGDLWTWGPDDAAQRVTGPALDFCLLATQRAHRDDLALTADGPDADRWLSIAQAFAGPPGNGRVAKVAKEGAA